MHNNWAKPKLQSGLFGGSTYADVEILKSTSLLLEEGSLLLETAECALLGTGPLCWEDAAPSSITKLWSKSGGLRILYFKSWKVWHTARSEVHGVLPTLQFKLLAITAWVMTYSLVINDEGSKVYHCITRAGLKIAKGMNQGGTSRGMKIRFTGFSAQPCDVCAMQRFFPLGQLFE